MNEESSYIASGDDNLIPVYGERNGIAQNPQRTAVDMRGYKLPKIVDVAVTIKFIENRKSTGIEDGNRKFYTFTPQTN